MRERVLGGRPSAAEAVLAVAVVAAVRVAAARARVLRRRRHVQIDAVVQRLVGEVLVHGAARHVLLDGKSLGHQLLDLLGNVVRYGAVRRKVQRHRMDGRGGRRRRQLGGRSIGKRLAMVRTIAQHRRHQTERGARAAVAVAKVAIADVVAGQHVLELGPVLVQIGAGGRDDLARQLGLERLLEPKRTIGLATGLMGWRAGAGTVVIVLVCC